MVLSVVYPESERDDPLSCCLLTVKTNQDSSFAGGETSLAALLSEELGFGKAET